MDIQLQQMKNLLKIRIRLNTLTTLRNMVYEEAVKTIDSSNDSILQALRSKGITDETSIKQFLDAMPAAIADTYMRQHGKELMARIPDIIVSEATKIGTEMAQLVSDAAGEATRETMEELADKRS
jgi:hypothetical protein